MFNKQVRKNIAHTFHKVKNFIGNAYGTTAKVLNNFDNGVKTFKTIYGAISPILDHYGVSGAVNPHVMKAISGYDQLKNKVMGAHDEAMDQVAQAKSRLGGHRRITFLDQN